MKREISSKRTVFPLTQKTIFTGSIFRNAQEVGNKENVSL
uniref:Uncharacterized protein n=1 Tax=Rhizophora mucronata TaxID=61149 RepID=A0A2P2R331_RHIMU